MTSNKANKVAHRGHMDDLHEAMYYISEAKLCIDRHYITKPGPEWMMDELRLTKSLTNVVETITNHLVDRLPKDVGV